MLPIIVRFRTLMSAFESQLSWKQACCPDAAFLLNCVKELDAMQLYKLDRYSGPRC